MPREVFADMQCHICNYLIWLFDWSREGLANFCRDLQSALLYARVIRSEVGHVLVAERIRAQLDLLLDL